MCPRATHIPASAIGRFTKKIIRHGSHCSQMDLPDLVNHKIEKFLEEIGSVAPKLFIPVSAIHGENLAAPAGQNMPWYDGPTLIEYLESVELDEDRRRLPRDLEGRLEAREVLEDRRPGQHRPGRAEDQGHRRDRARAAVYPRPQGHLRAGRELRSRARGNRLPSAVSAC